MAKINKRFQKFIDEENFWPKYSGQGEVIEFPLSQEDVNSLVNSLSNKLSPENLHCDGEISRSQAQSRYNVLMNVYKDLNTYGAKNGLNVPELYY